MSDAILNKSLNKQRFFALTFLVVILLSIVGAETSSVARLLSQGARVPVLLFGIDAADSSQHTDTLMVTVFDSLQTKWSALSIPRDTRIDWPGYRFHRVNEIFGYHYRKTKDFGQSAQKVIEGVQILLSPEPSQLSIPYYIQIDFNGFRKWVDLLGGVWVTIKLPMHYDDYAGNYHFHKEPGRYLLNGTESLLYVRFRGQTGDRGRIFRQQEFVKAMIRRMANPLLIFRIPQMVLVLKSSVHSNLSFWDWVYMAAGMRRLRPDDVGFYILPGVPRGVYWSPKLEMGYELADMLLKGAVMKETVEENIAVQASRITISVWNASGKKGMGYNITKILREKGYDVMDWGNYAAEQLQTRVIDRKGKIMNAKAVADSLGVESYHSEPNAKALVDVEVIIGQNYRGTEEALK
jgi:LCP family protein required for cell wall assembly